MPTNDPGNVLATIARDELSELTSFDDALLFLQSKGYEVGEATDLLGDGFASLEKKDLLNIPFVIVDTAVSLSKDYGNEFAVIRLITATNKRVRISDGSTGLCAQIMNLEAKRAGGARGVVCPKGLTVSEYKICDECGKALSEEKCSVHPKGKTSKAETFYIAM